MPHSFQPDDLFLHRQITSLHCTPSHGEAVCAVEHVDRDADSYLSTLWVLDVNGEREPLQITSGTALDAAPCWSHDGSRIAFLSDRAGGPPQPHVIDRHGGEARAVCQLPQGAQQLAWHPDGKRLLAVGTVAVDPDMHDDIRAGDPLPSRDENAPEVVWRLPYKLDGVGYTLAERVHLFEIDIASGQWQQITQGDFELRGLDIAPDGLRIAYTRTRTDAAHCTDVWVMHADGSQPRRLSHGQPTAGPPSWSPDGRFIVFSGSVDEGDAQARLWRINVASGDVSALGDESIEVVPGVRPCWSRDAAHFMCVLARRGLQQAASIRLADGHCEVRVSGERHIERLAATAERLVYTTTSPAHDQELHSAGWDGTHERQLSRFNAWWNERQAPLVQWRKFTVPDGEGGEEQIDGWLMLPAGHRQGRLPLLLDVHGGPASYVLLSYTSHPHWSVLCARGWAVLALNCVGSSSYGRAFSERLRARWGEIDLAQQIAAVKTLQQEGVVDDRLAVLGKSYGGFLSAWAIGHTNLFRSAVVMAPVGNLETHYGTSDSGFYADPYSMCGEPFIDRETSRKLSPMQYVQKTRTPTLFLQGKEDERCPKCQSEELYVTIARAGNTPTEMVLYPGGSHHFWEDGRPSHRIDALQRALQWLTRWIDKPLSKTSPQARGEKAHVGMAVAK